MKRLLFVVFLWILTFGAVGLINGSAGEQISRDVAVTQVEDSEIPYHATRNLETLKFVATLVVMVPAGTVTYVTMTRKG